VERAILGALVIAVIVAVVALDAIGVGWAIRKLWRGGRRRRS
jgi:hypothetical protein